jgi:hypothetical protein
MNALAVLRVARTAALGPDSLSLPLPDALPYEQWAALAQPLGLMDRAARWFIGDWLNYGEDRYGEIYAQAINDLGLSHGTLRVCAWTARCFAPVRRRTALSWSHHCDVAGQPEETQEILLDLAEERRWTRADLRAAMQEARQAPDVVLLPASGNAISEQATGSPRGTVDLSGPRSLFSNAPLNLSVLTNSAARIDAEKIADVFTVEIVLPTDPTLAAPILARHFTLAALAAVWPKERLG